MIWCSNNVKTDFSKYLFTDETTVRVLEVPIYHVRLPSSRPTAMPKSQKIRLKLNIWGGISFKGATPFVVR